MGVTWFRRGLQNLRCMPSMSILANKTQLNLTANDARYEEALAA